MIWVPSGDGVPVPEKEVLLACECDKCVDPSKCGCQDASERETGDPGTGFAYIDVYFNPSRL